MSSLITTLGYLLLSIQLLLPVYAGNSIESKEQRWLVLGDSLSAAYGMAQKEGWVNLLQEQLDTEKKQIKVHNASISGETTSGGLQRLTELMQTVIPSVLIIELGANDALRGQNLAMTKKNLKSMIDLCVQAKEACQPVLLGIRLPTNYGPAYDRYLQKIYKDLATEYQLPFDPFFLEEVALDPDLMQVDGLHPNSAAQPFIMNRVWGLLQSLVFIGDK